MRSPTSGRADGDDRGAPRIPAEQVRHDVRIDHNRSHRPLPPSLRCARMAATNWSTSSPSGQASLISSRSLSKSATGWTPRRAARPSMSMDALGRGLAARFGLREIDCARATCSHSFPHTLGRGGNRGRYAKPRLPHVQPAALGATRATSVIVPSRQGNGADGQGHFGTPVLIRIAISGPASSGSIPLLSRYSLIYRSSLSSSSVVCLSTVRLRCSLLAGAGLLLWPRNGFHFVTLREHVG